MMIRISTVAPYVGAWIETSYMVELPTLMESHPMWVRGLKLCFNKHPWLKI